METQLTVDEKPILVCFKTNSFTHCNASNNSKNIMQTVTAFIFMGKAENEHI